MAVDEHRRHQMYRRLEEVLGPDEASTLMEHLPPIGWADVARKGDLESIRRELTSDFRAMLESKLNSQMRALVTMMSALVLAVAGLAFAAARLA